MRTTCQYQDCGRKLTPAQAIANVCACGMRTCAKHRNEHGCAFDYAAAHQRWLRSQLLPKDDDDSNAALGRSAVLSLLQ